MQLKALRHMYICRRAFSCIFSIFFVSLILQKCHIIQQYMKCDNIKFCKINILVSNCIFGQQDIQTGDGPVFWLHCCSNCRSSSVLKIKMRSSLLLSCIMIYSPCNVKMNTDILLFSDLRNCA